MRNLVAFELRRLHRKVSQADRRVSLVNLSGKVKPGSQDMEKRTVRLKIGKTADGKDILSPPVRWQQPGAGNLKVHAVPKDDEQMDLTSPSGTIGAGSKAVWGTYDDDNKPPSKSKDEAVLQFGDDDKSKVTLGKEKLTSQYGDATSEVSADLVRGYVGQDASSSPRFVATKDLVKMRFGEFWVVISAQGIRSSHEITIGPDPKPDV